jgi:hypothetical protein
LNNSVSKNTTFSFQSVEPQLVYHLLQTISPSKATGVDKTAPVFAHSLTNLFNYSITTETFPSEWKISKVIPRHKSGSRNLLDNYGPISILPKISKIFEKIL